MSININHENVVEMACQDDGCKCVPIASKDLPVSIKLKIDNDIKRNSRYTSFVILPVETIDGIFVTCELVVNENGMSIVILTDKVKMFDKAFKEDFTVLRYQLLFRKTYIKKLTKYTLKDYESVLKHIHIDIKNMKFDKLNGVLRTNENKHPRDSPHVRSERELENKVPCDEDTPEECSVCLDTTKTATPCGHKLCVSCWGQIKKKGSEMPCPICRADLIQSKKFGIEEYDDDDDEDDDEQEEDDYVDPYGFGYETEDDDYNEFPSVRESSIMDIN